MKLVGVCGNVIMTKIIDFVKHNILQYLVCTHFQYHHVCMVAWYWGGGVLYVTDKCVLFNNCEISALIS